MPHCWTVTELRDVREEKRWALVPYDWDAGQRHKTETFSDRDQHLGKIPWLVMMQAWGKLRWNFALSFWPPGFCLKSPWGDPESNSILWGNINCPQLPEIPSQKALLLVGDQGVLGHREVAIGRHTEQQTLWTDGLSLRQVLAEDSLVELHFDSFDLWALWVQILLWVPKKSQCRTSP